MPDRRPSGVDADPFWSVLRRRHPDIDLVVLPGAAGAAEPSEPIETPEQQRRSALAPPAPPLRDPDEWSSSTDDAARGWWPRLLAGIDAAPGDPSARWLTSRDGLRRRETTLAAASGTTDPADPTTTLTRAARHLRDAGWRVLAPTDGVPRVLASRSADDALGREELALFCAPGRITLRLRTGTFRPAGAAGAGS